MNSMRFETLEVFEDSSDDNNDLKMDLYPETPSVLDANDDINIVRDAFSEMVSESTSQIDKIVVVLDCANVGWSFGMDHFSAIGVDIAVKYFQSFEMVQIYGFIPASFLRKKPSNGLKGNCKMETDDWTLLNDFVLNKIITLVPAGDSDDAYILACAREKNGFIVSNDYFTDHVGNIVDTSIACSMSVWLEQHRCQYTFAQNTFMINPKSILNQLLTTKNDIEFGPGSNAASAEMVAMISSLSTVIQQTLLLRTPFPSQLKCLLLARALSYLQLSQHGEALQDVRQACALWTSDSLPGAAEQHVACLTLLQQLTATHRPYG